MAHEITNLDQVVLHKTEAWHGLGIVVEEAPTPREALTLANLDWEIEQRPVFTKSLNDVDIPIPGYFANYRADENILMGIVSNNYVPVQNADMADFCEALTLTETPVKCETAGSIRQGAKVWFLLKGESFDVANGDLMFPYILVSNGHDGLSSFRVTPTTIRAVCSNTLHAIIPKNDKGQLKSSAISIRHTVNVKDRIVEAKRALSQFGKGIEETRKIANQLSEYQMNREDIEQFFLECYTRDFGSVSLNPQSGKEERRKDRAMDACNSFTRRFDDERSIAGASLWNAFNAYSGLVQHDKKSRGKTDADRLEKRVVSNLFGLNQDRTQAAIQQAYKMAN